MSPPPDLRLVPGPGLLTALLDAAGRSGLHARSVVLPSSGDLLHLDALRCVTLGARDATLAVDARMRGYGAGGERQHKGTLRLRAGLEVGNGALALADVRVEGDTAALLDAWSWDLGATGLADAVATALDEAWGAPIPLSWPGRLPDDLTLIGRGRRRPQPPPEPPSADLAIVASFAGLARLAAPAPLNQAADRVEAALPSGTVVLQADAGRVLTLDLPPGPLSLLSRAPLAALRRPVDALHDELHLVQLEPTSASLDGGLTLSLRARPLRRREAHRVRLVGFPGADHVTLQPPSGPPITLTLTRARAARAAGTLGPIDTEDPALVARLASAGL